MRLQLNFATEFLAEEAIARAKELDQYYQRTGKLVGPLVREFQLALLESRDLICPARRSDQRERACRVQEQDVQHGLRGLVGLSIST